MFKLIVLSSLLGLSLALEANLDFAFNWTHIERKGCRFSDYVSAKSPDVPMPTDGAPMDYLFMQNLGFGINRVTRQCALIAEGEECHWVGPISSGGDPTGGLEMSCPAGEYVSHVRCNNDEFEDCLGFDFLCCKAVDGRVTDYEREQWCQEIEGRWNVDQMPRSECAKWPVIDEVIVGFHCRGETGCEYPKTRCAPLVQPEELSACSHSGDLAEGDSSAEGPIVKVKCTGAGCSVFEVQTCPLLTGGAGVEAGTAVGDDVVSCPDNQYVSQIVNAGNGAITLMCSEGDAPVDHGADLWTINFSEKFATSETEDLNRAKCPVDHVLIGVACVGPNCESMTLRCAPVGSESGCAWGVGDGASPINALGCDDSACASVSVRSCPVDSGADCSDVGPVSGKDEEATCPEGQFVTAVTTDGASLTVTCCAGASVADHGKDNWSTQFNGDFGPNREAHGHTHNPELPMTNMAMKQRVPEGRCDDGEVVIGVRCASAGCADKRIQCAPLDTNSGCAFDAADDSPAVALKCVGQDCASLSTKQCPLTSGSDCSDVTVSGIGKAECPEDQFVSKVSQDGGSVTVTCCSAEAGLVADHGQAIGWSPQITGNQWDETFTSNCPTHEIMFAALMCESEAECEKQEMYCESQTFQYECPYDQVLVAVTCEDDDCNLKRINCAPLLPDTERSVCAWTDFYGEANTYGEDMAIPGAPIVSVRCVEPDCSTVSTKQCDIIKAQEGSCFWRNEGLTSNVKCRHNCPAGMYIAGLRCTDTDGERNCYDLQYQCCLPDDGEAQLINFVDQDFRSPEFTGSVVDRWRLNEAHCSYGTVLIGLICTGCDCNLKRALCSYTEFNWGDPLPNADLPLYNL